jgi:molybdopterin converting factor subunit 1
VNCAPRIKILYFAQAREAAGSNAEDMQVGALATVGDVLSKAVEAHPSLTKLKRSLRIALNEEIADANERVEEGDRVALLPPVVGG